MVESTYTSQGASVNTFIYIKFVTFINIYDIVYVYKCICINVWIKGKSKYKQSLSLIQYPDTYIWLLDK